MEKFNIEKNAIQIIPAIPADEVEEFVISFNAAEKTKVITVQIDNVNFRYVLNSDDDIAISLPSDNTHYLEIALITAEDDFALILTDHLAIENVISSIIEGTGEISLRITFDSKYSKGVIILSNSFTQ